MYGKISTGIVAIETPPRMAMSTATTTKVYGRRSASLTIHMIHVRNPRVLAVRTSPVRHPLELWIAQPRLVAMGCFLEL